MLSAQHIFDLPLDIKCVIALNDQHVWIYLSLYDNAFGQYARSQSGLSQFVRAFTEKRSSMKCKSYSLLGKLHRTNGPAVIKINNDNNNNNNDRYKTYYWYQSGRLHRLSGPAVIYPNGQSSYYINGEWQRTKVPTRRKKN